MTDIVPIGDLVKSFRGRRPHVNAVRRWAQQDGAIRIVEGRVMVVASWSPEKKWRSRACAKRA